MAGQAGPGEEHRAFLTGTLPTVPPRPAPCGHWAPLRVPQLHCREAQYRAGGPRHPGARVARRGSAPSFAPQGAVGRVSWAVAQLSGPQDGPQEAGCS